MTELKYDPRNYRIHTDKNKRLIKKSLEDCGTGRSILLDKNDVIIAGNGVDGLSCDGVIADSGGFYSMCEHHMMPFFGKYWFAYIPNPKGKILGISKVGRVVDYCAARLQVQERLAKDIIVMLQEALGSEYPPLAMGIVLEGEHLCKSMRGVKKEGKMRSSFYFDNGSLPELRAELSRFVSFG